MHRGHKPRAHSWRGLCWSWLACDGLGGVSVSSRRLHRGHKPRAHSWRGLCWSWLACDSVGGVSVSSQRLHRGQARLLQAGAGAVGAGLPAIASVGCPRIRGVCIAGKPGSYRLRGLCWSRLACDGVGGVITSSRRLYRGQARLLQVARALLELAGLRWRRWGVSGFAVSASRASPAPTGWRGLCWSWLACDGLGGVSVSSRRLYRGQARLLQAGAGAVGAGLPAMASVGYPRVSGVCIAGKPGSYRLARALLELACLRWRLHRWQANSHSDCARR